MPEGADSWGPEEKVSWFLDHSAMFIALATADDRLERGTIQTRQNIIDEIRAARERPHLKHRLQIFRSRDVQLPSNINPAYDRLDPAHLDAACRLFETQARAYGVLPPLTGRSSPEAAKAATSVPPEIDDGFQHGSQDQIRLALSRLAEASRDPKRESDPFDLQRVHLAASAEYASGRSADPYGVHDLNGLYGNRDRLLLRSSERRHLLRSILLNISSENAPGWFWFRDGLDPNLLLELTASDQEEAVRSAALRLLAKCDWPARPAALKPAVQAALGSGSQRLAELALEVLAENGDSALLRGLAPTFKAYRDQEAVRSARVRVQARTAPVTAFRTVLNEPSLLTQPAADTLALAATQLSVKDLRTALEADAPRVRQLALEALNSKSQLRKSEVVKLATEDSAGEVRLRALRIILKRGWKITENQLEEAIREVDWNFDRKEELRRGFYAGWSEKELRDALDWQKVSGWTIYGVLAEHHFSSFSEQLRTELANDFDGLQQAAEARLQTLIREAIEAGVAKELEEGRRRHALQPDELERETAQLLSRVQPEASDPSTRDFVLRQFQAAALRGIALHGSKADREVVRSLLGSEDMDLSRLAVQALGRIGEQKDVPSLLGIAVSAPLGGVREQAARAALALSTDPVQTAMELLKDRTTTGVISIALDKLKHAEIEGPLFRSLFELIEAEEQGIRVLATDFLIARFPERRLIKFLNAYSQGHHYYNVVCRIDRALYAPSWVKAAL